MKPWMSDKDINLIEKEILRLGLNHVSVLEWGSGGSTKHFTDFMRNNGITYEWVSIEYNKEWYDKVNQLNIPNVDIKLFDVGNNNLKQRNTNMDEYVNYPSGLGKKFDIILVDGRKRRRCLINASKLITDNGVVILHDAERSYYHCAFKSFKSHKFLSKHLWVGRSSDLISVIMPAFMVEKHKGLFKQAIEGIVEQSYSNWELLIVIDGPSKKTIKYISSIIREEFNSDARISVYNNPQSRLGPGIVRNIAFKYAKGKYITTHDTDDFSAPDRFEKLMSRMDEGGIVASNIYVNTMYDGGEIKHRIKKYPGGNKLHLLVSQKKVRAPIHFPSAIISTELFKEMGGFEKFRFSSDGTLAIKLGYFRELMLMPPIPIIEEPLFVWNRHSHSITTLSENSYELKKCQKAQRKPLVRGLRELFINNMIDFGDSKDKIKNALGIKDNLKTSTTLVKIEI